MFGMNRTEIEHLRRSIAMLPPQAAGLSREDAMRLLADFQEVEQRFRKLQDGLVSLLEETRPSLSHRLLRRSEPKAVPRNSTEQK